eukprot:UN25498
MFLKKVHKYSFFRAMRTTANSSSQISKRSKNTGLNSILCSADVRRNENITTEILTDRVTATLLEVVQSNDSDDTEIRHAQRYLDLGSK